MFILNIFQLPRFNPHNFFQILFLAVFYFWTDFFMKSGKFFQTHILNSHIMSVDASCDSITNHIISIKHMYLDHENKLKTLKDENEKSSSKIIALEIQVQEMASLVAKNTAIISKHQTEMHTKNSKNKDLKRKCELLEEESVNKTARNLKLCDELKKISDKIGETREKTRQLELEEGKIQTQQNKSKTLQMQ